MKRDPSLWIAAIAALLGVGVSLGLENLSVEQAGAIMGLITAVGGAITALRTRPVPPSVFVGVLGGLGILLTAYHVDISQEVLSAVQVLVSTLVGILTWQSVSPTESPAAVRSASRAA